MDTADVDFPIPGLGLGLEAVLGGPPQVQARGALLEPGGDRILLPALKIEVKTVELCAVDERIRPRTRYLK